MSMHPFHYRYVRGIEAILGGDSSLGSELEPFGGPIEPHAPWSSGGPFVWRRQNNKTTLIGWARAVAPEEAGRSGAWEAWGVDVDDPSVVNRWPFAWEELRQSPTPDSLKRLVSRLSSDPLGGLPRLRGTEGAALTRAYLAHVDDNGESIAVPLESADDVGLLPWLWLLGPVAPAQATLTTPRSGAPTLHPRPTYAPRIDLDPPHDAFVSPAVQDILSHAASRRWNKAIDAAQELRRLPAAKQLTILRGSAAPERSDTRASVPSASLDDERSPITFERVLLTATFVAALIAAILTARLQPEWSTPTPAPIPAATETTATAPITTPDTTPTAPIVARPAIAWTESVHGALTRSTGTKGTDVAALLKLPATTAFDSTAKLRLRLAGWQLYLRSRNWYSGSLDASPGRTFYAGITQGAADERLQKILQSDEELGKWAESYAR
jgi:hypothetical protein